MRRLVHVRVRAFTDIRERADDDWWVDELVDELDHGFLVGRKGVRQRGARHLCVPARVRRIEFDEHGLVWNIAGLAIRGFLLAQHLPWWHDARPERCLVVPDRGRPSAGPVHGHALCRRRSAPHRRPPDLRAAPGLAGAAVRCRLSECLRRAAAKDMAALREPSCDLRRHPPALARDAGADQGAPRAGARAQLARRSPERVADPALGSSGDGRCGGCMKALAASFRP
mmetsp:Transcript_17732/g.49123  ORF Transcript_17732/g.49123 Transcript_17732/m.49123 type:complete len:227 (-) Transcript_17732:190-870(-)